MPERLWKVCGRGRRLTSGGGGARARARVNVARVRAVVGCALLMLSCLCPLGAHARKKPRAPAGGRAGVVVDERLAVLRDAPDLTAGLVRRLGRGRLVAVTGAREAGDGVRFYRVVVTRRTAGWVQADALVVRGRAGEDERLLRLVRASNGFERVARARIFLDAFPRSTHRAAVLLLLGEAADEAAATLTREARRRLDERELSATGAPLKSFFLNYNGLDRYRRHGVVFRFDEAAKSFHYDGWAWREILRRHPRGAEAVEARRRLAGGATAPR
jgi:hypothetical protein